ncbi:hypothetical protein M8J76_003819 [Diaphorina citri]|nr:hypothetical protein M8J76_003819 [Diaphorina citri]
METLNSEHDKPLSNEQQVMKTSDTRRPGPRRQSTAPTSELKPPARRYSRRKHEETIECIAHSSLINSNGGVTPRPDPESKQCAEEGSPSLWLRKTPEEIFDFYKTLGPDWRNEFEKTDLTYSPSSPWYNKEVVPGSGIPVIPNMSREPVGVYARNLRNRKKTAVDLNTLGVYARNLRNRKKTAVDLNTYAVELCRTGDHYLTNDRRASLAYGLNHSPSLHYATPTSQYNGYKPPSRPSSHTSFISTVTSHLVTMVTKVFTFIWSIVYASDSTGGVDTVDHAPTQHPVQNYEYKTGVKRSMMYRTLSRNSSSSWYHHITQYIYRLSTWLIETNTRIFWYKDRSVDSVLPQRVKTYSKYMLLLLMILLLGFWMFCPLYSDLVSSTSSPVDLTSTPWTATVDFISTPISTTVDFLRHLVSLCITSLYATGQYITTPIYATRNFISAIPSYLSTPFYSVGNVLSAIPSYLSNPFYSVGNVLISIPSYLSIPFYSAGHFLSAIPSYASVPVYAVAQAVSTVVNMLWGGVHSMVMLGGGLFSSVSVMTTTPASTSKISDSPVYTPPPVQQTVQHQEPVVKQIATPSIEDIVLRVLEDTRFHSMIEQNVKSSVDKNQEKQNQEKELLQEKVKELCARLVETELIKFKSAIDKQQQETQQHLQNSIPAPPVEELLVQIKQLEAEHQTSFLDLMSKFSILVDDKIKAAFAMYDADRTGLTDYALESAGGSVIDIRCTETYTLKDPYYVLFGYALWRRDSSPRKAIQPGLLPGDCWAFQGAIGCLVLKLSHRIQVTRFSMEHIPKTLTPNGIIDSAPKKFAVWGLREKYDENPTLLGEFMYDSEGPTLQYFEAKMVADTFDMVELKILSNHGNIEYTCLYRFRVHGNLAPSPSPVHTYNRFSSANHNTLHHMTSSKYNPV